MVKCTLVDYRRCSLGILKTVLTVLYVLDCVGLIIVVLMQEGKQQGLGSVAGMADTYWEKQITFR